MPYIPGSLAAPEGLLIDLEAVYPNHLPDPKDSTAEMWIKVGEQRVLEFLWAKFKDFNEGILI